MFLKLCIRHRVLEYYKVCSNNAPGLTFTYFTARSNLILYAFVQEKNKTMYFSETIILYDIKVGRCSQLKWVHKALGVPKVKVIHWAWSNAIRFNILKLLFLNNRWFQHNLSIRWAIQDQWSSGFLFMWHWSTILKQLKGNCLDYILLILSDSSNCCSSGLQLRKVWIFLNKRHCRSVPYISWSIDFALYLKG